MVATNYNYTKNNLDFQGFDDSLPPQSVELEEQILGGILLDSNAIERVKDILPSEAFYLEANQIIYRACLALYDQGKACDLMTVEAYLKEKRKYSKVGEKPKLVTLVSRTVSAVNIDFYAETVVRKWYQRQLIELSRHTERACFSNPTSVDQLIENLREDIEKLADSPFLKRDGDPQFAEYQRLIEKIREIELNNNPGYRRWLLGGLAKEYGRSAKELEDIYFKELASTECEPSMTISELREKYGDDVNEWLLHGFLPKGSTVLLHALGYTGKTRLMYDFIYHLVTGQPWGEHFTPTASTRRCMIIQTDEPQGDMIRALEDRGLDEEHYPIRYKTRWLFDHLEDLRREIEEYRPELIFIDSLTSVNRRSWYDENQTEYARPVLQLRDIAQEFGCTIVITHHSNSEGGSRGTKAIFNSVSEVWKMSRAEGDKKPDSPIRELTIEKSRSRSPEKYRLAYNPYNSSWEFLGVCGEESTEYLLSELEQQILDYLRQNPNKRFRTLELEEIFNTAKRSIIEACTKLSQRGLISKRKLKGKGQPNVYYITNSSDDFGGFRQDPPPPKSNPDGEGVSGGLGGISAMDSDHFSKPNKNEKSEKPAPKSAEKAETQTESEVISAKDSPPKSAEIRQNNSEKAETQTESEVISAKDSPPKCTKDPQKTTIKDPHKTTFQIGDRVLVTLNPNKPKREAYVVSDYEYGRHKIIFLDGKEPNQTFIEPEALELKERHSVTAYQKDLPHVIVERLVTDYLRKHGESNEYQIICDIGQKSPVVRTALQKVAIQTQQIHKGGYYDIYWELREDCNE